MAKNLKTARFDLPMVFPGPLAERRQAIRAARERRESGACSTDTAARLVGAMHPRALRLYRGQTMARTFLEARLDAAFGEMPQHGGDQLGCVRH